MKILELDEIKYNVSKPKEIFPLYDLKIGDVVTNGSVIFPWQGTMMGTAGCWIPEKYGDVTGNG